ADAVSARGRSVSVLEGQPFFGGLLRTTCLGGHLFDTGPHGIYCPDAAVASWFWELLGEDMVPIDRRSFTLFRGRRVPYPLTLRGALSAVKPLEAARVAYEAGVSRALRRPPGSGASFEEWAIQSFGPTLYRLFFKDYTEKVRGLPCGEMSAGWISAHLPANSLLRVLYDRLRRSSLPIGFVSRFHYSARGSGWLVERLVERLAARAGIRLRSGCRILRLGRQEGCWSVDTQGTDGSETWEAPVVVSTIPSGTLVELLAPPAADEL